MRVLLRVGWALLIAAVAVIWFAPSAGAMEEEPPPPPPEEPPPPPPDPSGGGDIDAEAVGGDNPGFTVTIHDDDAPWVSVVVDPCTHVVYDFPEAYVELATLLALGGYYIGGEVPTEEEYPHLYANPWLFSYCPSDYYVGIALTNIVQITVDPPDESVMLAEVRGALEIPLPGPIFSPAAADGQITGIETWVWLPNSDTATQTVTSCVGPNDYACASMTAEFSGLTVDMGDGEGPFVCGWSRPYDTSLSYEDQADLSHCGHVYTQATGEGERYDALSTTVWHITWSCWWDSNLDGFRESSCVGATGPDLGFTGRTGAPVPMDVRDIQAQGTGRD